MAFEGRGQGRAEKREKDRGGRKTDRRRGRERGTKGRIAEGKSGKVSCGCESVLSRGETINFAGIHVDRREDEPTSTIDGLCWPTVSHLPSSPFTLPSITPYCAPFPLDLLVSVVPISRAMHHPDVDGSDTMRQRSRTRFGLFPRRKLVPETGTLTPTCPVTSHSLFGLSNATIRSRVLELRQERVTRYHRMMLDGEEDGKRGIRAKEWTPREKLYRRPGIAGMGWDFRGVFGKMRQRAPRPVGSSS